jgi:glycine cleavage system T protein
MKKTPLYDIHARLGAVFDQYSGWLMPKNYGDQLGEYKTVRNNAGIIDLSHRGKLRLSGREHIKFLQGMLTNDVNKLGVGKGLYATLLTPKGRMLVDMRLYRHDEFVLLDLEPGLNEKVGELLMKYRLSYRAIIEDVTESLALISIHGPNSGKLLRKALDEEIPELSEYDFLKRDLLGSQLTIARINRTGEEGYDIFVGSDLAVRLWELLTKNGEEFGIKPVGLDVMETLRIEAGIPIYGVDMDESTIPIEAGLWHALSFDKGCYVGQEVVARINWRGHVNRHLVGFLIEGEELPKSGDKILDGEREIGYITSSVFSPALRKGIALGYIRREFIEPGTKVSVRLGEGKIESAEVVKMPFYEKP